MSLLTYIKQTSAYAWVPRRVKGVARAVWFWRETLACAKRARVLAAARRKGVLFNVVIPSTGCVMRLDPFAWVTKEWYVDGAYEAETVAFVKRSIQPGMACLDVGANAGFFTLLMAQLTGPSGQVFAFEPTARVFEILNQNIRLNGFHNVQAECSAVGECSGETEFREGPSGFEVYNTIGAVAHQHARSQAFTVTRVPLTRMDDYCRRQGIQHLDFVKVDVEGAELLVLRGMEEIAGKSPGLVVVIETDGQMTQSFGYEPQDVVAWFHAHGFEVYDLNSGGEPVPRIAAGRSVNLVARRS